ncbi:GntR family transcriptional regulator [Arthrobacter subterraneus]|uniref:GntR family transcriptional regulator n=1 Tax=Arthrobacter subterraneus TaxID=335973 RepID=UPI001FE0C018|nr:GntR family transcriptional regulator [Arthrobacter subterraneus]
METILKLPIHERLSEEFRNRIAQGIWAPGSQLPSEAELCREFGTSRGPVRQALAALRAEGVLTGGRGRPPRVCGQVQSQSFSTFLSFTEWALSVGKVPGQRTQEIARRTASEEAASYLCLPHGEPVVELLRLRLLDGVPAMIERTSFVLPLGNRLFDFDTDSGSIFAFLLEQGADLFSARHTIDAVAAGEQDAALLGQPVGTPLLRERRVTSSSTGSPLEYSDDRYLPTLTNFTIENNVQHRAGLVRVHTA